MIVATSGHIDHGKTVLVKALTGVDTDRLPEEKNRGISIDLGYAYRALEGDDGEEGGSGEEVLGFVDVPGHERFVRNMLAGVTGIDYALLIVAADDGPMPQTEEHLAILDLLGIREGAVVITKTDRVEPERVAEVEELLEILLDETFLAGAPVFAASAIKGDGIAEIRAHLADVARRMADRKPEGAFRLAIDRRFIVPGSGLVVTGTVFSGQVAPEDQLVLSPSGRRVRVRGLHAQNREAVSGMVGQRCAVNIAATGLDRDAVHRGDWLVAERAHAPTQRFDARIRLLRTEKKPLRHWTPLHLHVGAADIAARVAVLGARQIEPGESALVQLVLDRPTNLLRDDRLILRDQSATRTLAGGRVLDPWAQARGRARPARLETLALLELDDPAEAMTALLENATDGVDLAAFARARNLDDAAMDEIAETADMVRLGRGEEARGVSRTFWQALKEATLAALADWHRDKPGELGPAANALRQRLEARPSPAIFSALIATLSNGGKVATANMQISLADHVPGMPGADRKIWERAKKILQDGGARPPSVHEMAEEMNLKVAPLNALLRRAAAIGFVVQVAKNRFILRDEMLKLAEIAEQCAADSDAGTFTAAEYRNASGIGRNLTIELLETLDRAGMTKRSGNDRIIVKPAAELYGEVEAGAA
jgi:selenocysteine-specific elongation factor